MKPIPKKLLIHSASAVIHGEPDKWGNKPIESTTQLSHVRVDPSSSLSLNNRNEQVRLSAVLFFDCKNSRPAGFDFEHTQKIVYGGQEYNIVQISKFFDESRLHHYEVELCL